MLLLKLCIVHSLLIMINKVTRPRIIPKVTSKRHFATSSFTRVLVKKSERKKERKKGESSGCGARPRVRGQLAANAAASET